MKAKRMTVEEVGALVEGLPSYTPEPGNHPGEVCGTVDEAELIAAGFVPLDGDPDLYVWPATR